MIADMDHEQIVEELRAHRLRLVGTSPDAMPGFRRVVLEIVDPDPCPAHWKQRRPDGSVAGGRHHSDSCFRRDDLNPPGFTTLNTCDLCHDEIPAGLLACPRCDPFAPHERPLDGHESAETPPGAPEPPAGPENAPQAWPRGDLWPGWEAERREGPLGRCRTCGVVTQGEIVFRQGNDGAWYHLTSRADDLLPCGPMDVPPRWTRRQAISAVIDALDMIVHADASALFEQADAVVSHLVDLGILDPADDDT